MTEFTKENVAKELANLVKAGLVDVSMREDGEWIYSLSEFAKTLDEQQTLEIINQIDQEDNESN
jgi:hypothetical protein